MRRKEPTPAMIAVGGREAYESFVRECGVEKHALVVTYDKLSDDRRARWETMGQEIYAKMEETRLTERSRRA